MILNMKSYHHLRAGEIDQALEAACRSLSVAPLQNMARLLKGLALFRKQAHLEALPLLLQAYRFVSLPPKDRKSDISFEDSLDKIDLVEIIGVCFAETGRFGEAIPFLMLTGRLKPGPAVFERLGVCSPQLRKFFGCFGVPPKGAERCAGTRFTRPSACLRIPQDRRPGGGRAILSQCPAQGQSEISIAFQMIQAMAADNAFRPYLRAVSGARRMPFAGLSRSDF